MAGLPFSRFPQADMLMPPRVPAPSHRHGAPSGPWPFVDLDSEIDPGQLVDPTTPVRPACEHTDPASCNSCWAKYPQSLFPNWTPAQQEKSRISRVVARSSGTCIIHHVDVLNTGRFLEPGDHAVDEDNTSVFWQIMHLNRPQGTRVRALFVDHLSGPVLQMLGTKYNIEPFFFSSSLGWTPSRYQEDMRPAEGDHITITLTFIRTIANPTTRPPSPSSGSSTILMPPPNQVIDTQAPLTLRSSDRILLPDLLALHMVRGASSDTIISYHPGPEHRATSAKSLHARVHAAGRSVYWQKIFTTTNDSTFVLLSILWYALYSWDEAFEALYTHIGWLESRVIVMNDMDLTQDLHIVRAHLLHYASLLDDFRKTINFVLDTPNPALDNRDLFSTSEKQYSQDIMKKECGNLLMEIERLEMSRSLQDKRVKNVMNLGFSSVSIADSSHMQKLTESAVRDSAAMKQISYLTMVFLPASFAASVFGMNIKEINGSSHTALTYVATALPLTAVTIWVIMAFQYQKKRSTQGGVVGRNEDSNDGQAIIEDVQRNPVTMWRRLMWPAVFIGGVLSGERRGKGPLIPR